MLHCVVFKLYEHYWEPICWLIDWLIIWLIVRLNIFTVIKELLSILLMLLLIFIHKICNFKLKFIFGNKHHVNFQQILHQKRMKKAGKVLPWLHTRADLSATLSVAHCVTCTFLRSGVVSHTIAKMEVYMFYETDDLKHSSMLRKKYLCVTVRAHVYAPGYIHTIIHRDKNVLEL